jgi:hypothetical protein
MIISAPMTMQAARMDTPNNPASGALAFFLGNVVIALLVWILVFGFLGAIAAIVAPPRRRLRFFVLTFCFLGPLGIGFAAVAPPVPLPKVDESWEFQCDRCSAWQNVGWGEKTAECWRCTDMIFDETST